MIDLLAALFVTPASLSNLQHLLMLGPLCLSISIVYKAIKCQDLREVPTAALVLWITILLGMLGVGVGVWLLYLLLS